MPTLRCKDGQMTGRPKTEKRGTDYIWMYVTDDAFEFPIYIEESITDLAQRLGKTELAIRSAVCHAEKKGRKSQYRRVKK